MERRKKPSKCRCKDTSLGRRKVYSKKLKNVSGGTSGSILASKKKSFTMKDVFEE